jgi:uncharacterized protein YkwD
MCLVNYARRRRGLTALREAAAVSSWAASKAADIARCHHFAHNACGKPPDGYTRADGFRGSFGENLYLGPQIYKTPLAAVDGWLNSPGHRENLFRPVWRSQGIALLHTPELRGQQDVAIWVSEFIS